MPPRFFRLLLVICVLLPGVARADDVFYVVNPDQLKLIGGTMPEAPVLDWERIEQDEAMRPYAVLDGAGEIYLQTGGDDAIGFAPGALRISLVAIRVSDAHDVTGRLYVPKSDLSGMESLGFSLSSLSTRPASRAAFFDVKRIHYQRLADLERPGSAWFRHVAREAAKEAGKQPAPVLNQGWPRWSAHDNPDDLVALYSGGRAVSESLQLDRLLPVAGNGVASVDVDSIAGISTTPMDWSKKIHGLTPQTDALAALVPADQPAIFFPTFSAMESVVDEADRLGSPLLTAIEPVAQDSLTRDRYEKQLGISLNRLARLVGPALIKSVAITASDPYLRSGTDLTLLLEPNDPAALKSLLVAQLKASSPADATISTPDAGTYFAVAVTPDNAVCSYMATVGNAIVIANSRAAIERLLNVQQGKTAALATAPEYVFFRDRYKIGQGNESAFLVLTDATIRRWCGARWRIAAARRMRAAAIMSEIQAAHQDEMVLRRVPDSQVHTDLPAADMGNLSLTLGGVQSSEYGSLQFMRPIAQMQFTKVTQAEADAYARWRDSYEQNWRWFFDPIAVRFGVADQKLSADLSIMPLIVGTDYAQIVDIAGSAKIGPQAADPHDDVVHLVMAVDRNSKTVHPAENFIGGMVPGIGVDPLGWLGQWVSLYADDDPFWKEMADAKDVDQFFESNYARAPVALDVNISSRFKLTAFLVAIRAFIEQTAPQTITWEAGTYHDQPYVKISPTAQTIAQTKELKDAAIYYAITSDALILTPNLAVLERALDRSHAREAAATNPSASGPGAWLGESLAARIDQKLLDLIRRNTRERSESIAQNLSWENLPILNEYKRLYPDEDPLKLYERLWGVRLVDPAGGQYVWNAQWHTMESTVYGSPAQPRSGPAESYLPDAIKSGSFGLTFEDQGLRAAAAIDRNGR